MLSIIFAILMVISMILCLLAKWRAEELQEELTRKNDKITYLQSELRRMNAECYELELKLRDKA